MPKINREALGSFPLPKPPLSEQKEIITALRTKLAKTDVVIQSVDVSNRQLAEYRSTLITAAVTGQIEGLQ